MSEECKNVIMGSIRCVQHKNVALVSRSIKKSLRLRDTVREYLSLQIHLTRTVFHQIR